MVKKAIFPQKKLHSGKKGVGYLARKMAKFECRNDHHYMPGGKWQNQNHAWYTGQLDYVVLSHFSAKKNAQWQDIFVVNLLLDHIGMLIP